MGKDLSLGLLLLALLLFVAVSTPKPIKAELKASPSEINQFQKIDLVTNITNYADYPISNLKITYIIPANFAFTSQVGCNKEISIAPKHSQLDSCGVIMTQYQKGIYTISVEISAPNLAKITTSETIEAK